MKGKKCYSINAIDSVTKFNIETYFTEHRDKESFRQFFKNIKAKINDQVMEIYKEEKKKKKEERKLVTFVSDKLEQYKDAFNKYFYRTAKLVHGVPIACRKYGLQHNNTVERHNQFIGRRCDLMRGFKDGNSAATFLSLNRVYYNYIRPHSSLSWGTPAEAAGINLHFEGNPWIFLVKKFFIPFYLDIFAEETPYSHLLRDFMHQEDEDFAEELMNN